MSADWDALFANVRRSPFREDANAVPQEQGSGNGNIAPTGWLEDGSVTADVIRANAVTAGKVDADAITAREIAANTITAAEIAAGTITATEIAADSITTSELAADAVITENILAANVTSSRIELTLTGKNYGANNGDSTGPGVFFDSDGTTGMGYDTVGGGVWIGKSISFTGSGGSWVTAMWWDSTSITAGNSIIPYLSASLDLGSSTKRWNTVYGVTSNFSSDARLKDDIQDEPLGLDFIESLRPVAFVWRDTDDTQAVERAEGSLDREAYAIEVAPHHRRIRRIRALMHGGRISDVEADERVKAERAAIAAIEQRHFYPLIEAQRKRRRGRRLHHGLIAQEVKAALDAAGVDAGFWQQNPQGEQSLSYNELIAPLIKSVQQLAERNAELERRMAALEAR